MSFFLPDGTPVETGVAQESPASAIQESPGHARDAFPQAPLALDFTFAFATLFQCNNGVFADATANVSVCSPDTYVMAAGWQASNGSSGIGGFETGTYDTRGYQIQTPIINPAAMTFSGTAVWSGSASDGQPYLTDAGIYNDPDGSYGSAAGPFYGYCLASLGQTATYVDNSWYQPGEWSGTLSLNEQASAQFGMNQEGIGSAVNFTLTLGEITITATRAAGFSCDTPGVIISNTNSPTDGLNYWTADFTYTFVTPWQFGGVFGPLNGSNPSPPYYASAPSSQYGGGGMLSISISI